MGLKVKYLKFFFASLRIAGIVLPYTNIRMAELGNQRMKYKGDPELAGYVKKFIDVKDGCIDAPKTGKEFFTALGFDHTSFDINGKDGALPIDLTEPLPAEHFEKYDIVTNFGTTEHIKKQTAAFKNIHNLLKRGGIAIHIVPLEGGILGHHGVYQYSYDFFEMLCLRHKYDFVVSIQERVEIPGCLTCCLRKL